MQREEREQSVQKVLSCGPGHKSAKFSQFLSAEGLAQGMWESLKATAPSHPHKTAQLCPCRPQSLEGFADFSKVPFSFPAILFSEGDPLEAEGQ